MMGVPGAPPGENSQRPMRLNTASFDQAQGLRQGRGLHTAQEIID